jgi:CubicO group peptidase (beta-lactamase class C family)
MMKRVPPLIAWLVLWAAASAQSQAAASLDSVSRYITAEMKREQIPGASVAILRGDSVILARGYGWANLELRAPARDSTIYQSGSMGKQFTSTGILLLAAQGRLSLDDRITKWLPEGAGVWDSVSIRDLLTHTGGIAEYTDSSFDLRKDYTEDQLVRFAASRPLDFSPGARWSYSNTGYLLLGVLIHRVTGRFYGEVLRQLIFEPVGMRTTRIISEADIIPHRAAGYQLVSGRLKNQDWVSPSLNTTADGALYFSVLDLIAWARALNGGPVPGAALLQRAWTPVQLRDGGSFPYGFGWDLTEQRDHRRIGHTGSWQGFKTAMFRYPEYNLTVIMLANLAQAQPGAMVQAIAGLLEPALRPPHLLAASLPLPAPIRVSDVVRQAASDTSTMRLSDGLRRWLAPSVRSELKQLLGETAAWKERGCDPVGDRSIMRLGARIERICYALATGARTRSAVSIAYTAEGLPAFIDYYGY